MTPSSDRLPTAWLFTQGESSVHMEVTERSRSFHLAVRGPGAAVAGYEFPDRDALLKFAEEKERELVNGGFQLQAVAERRSGDNRLGARRPERRRS